MPVDSITTSDGDYLECAVNSICLIYTTVFTDFVVIFGDFSYPRKNWSLFKINICNIFQWDGNGFISLCDSLQMRYIIASEIKKFSSNLKQTKF